MENGYRGGKRMEGGGNEGGRENLTGGWSGI